MLALKMGATALESDVWISSDGYIVMDHDGVVRKWRKTVKIRDVRRSDLPSHIPSLLEFYQHCGTNFDLSLDVKDAKAAAEVVNVSRKFDPAILRRLWLCHPDWRVVAGWRSLSDEIKLVDSTRIKHVKEGFEHRLVSLVEARTDAVNMHHTDWTASYVEMVHAKGLLAMAWDLQRPADLKRLLEMNVDAIFSDHVDRMKQSVDDHVKRLKSQDSEGN